MTARSLLRQLEQRGSVVVKDLALLSGGKPEPDVVVDCMHREIHG
jgi:hypothetical protein